MSGPSNHPVPLDSGALDGVGDTSELANRISQGELPVADSGPKLQRYVSALNRFKWLIIVLTLLGGAGGYAATGYIDPQYQVDATIAMGLDGANPLMRGQDAGLMDRDSWQDLLRSYAVVDPVVTRLSLYLQPKKERDSSVFHDFQVAQNLTPGDYVLKVDGRAYRLLVNNAITVDSGTVGDSIGRNRGFLWRPSVQELSGHNDVAFTVKTPREASRDLNASLSPNQRATLLKLTLVGKNSQRLAATLNAWTEQFIAEATALKKNKVKSLSMIVTGERDYQYGVLTEAERALQNFRVATVTQPNERQPMTSGLEMTTPSAYGEYFSKRFQLESTQRDRQNLQKLLDSTRAAGTGLTVEAVLSIPSVNNDPAAKRVIATLDEQSARESSLRKLREEFTDLDEKVIHEKEAVDEIRLRRVPRELAAYVAQLELREKALNEGIEISSQNLKGIPPRTIEEQRLQRNRDEAVEAYKSLDAQARQAQLNEASTIPDVSILDSAVAPLFPTRNTAPVLILGAVGASLGLGVLLAVLLDQTDKRFRYPEQATDELGLQILGVVPVIGAKSRRSATTQAAQVVETFRTIRMNVRYATEPGRALTLTISSPGPNDGKSLISSNLALSFAESGARTLLIDGDIRRGELSKTFGTKARPGIVEYLDGTALIAEVLQPTGSHPNLTVMSAGARRRRAPELLATPRLPQLIAQLSAEYDVIIMDSPPLGAGFDAFALATATGNLAIVLRAGITDRKMAKAKLETVAQLPIRLIGTVLNSIKLSGAYQYYSYYQEYAAEDEEAPKAPARLPGNAERPGETVVTSSIDE